MENDHPVDRYSLRTNTQQRLDRYAIRSLATFAYTVPYRSYTMLTTLGDNREGIPNYFPLSTVPKTKITEPEPSRTILRPTGRTPTVPEHRRPLHIICSVDWWELLIAFGSTSGSLGGR